MMKFKSPIIVSEVQFCSMDFDEMYCAEFADQFVYDRRHDFLVDGSFYGIAAKVVLERRPAGGGVRRRLRVCLVDGTSRCEVAVRQVKVSMGRYEFCKDVYVCFAADMVEFQAGHSYRLVVSDASTCETLAVESVHLVGREHGNAEDWYSVVDGGVTSSWDCDTFYKSLKTVDYHDYYVRFNVAQNFGAKVPEILPELEVRLHYPDGKRVDVRFMEPRCVNYDGNSYFVQCPLMTTEDVTGMFYAELLCMQYVLAGFAFGTNLEDVKGRWFGSEIEPMEEYSPAAARDRLRELLPEVHIPDSWDKLLDEALDEFIESQMAELDKDEDAVDECVEEVDEAEVTEDGEGSEPDDGKPVPELSLEQLTGLAVVKEKLAVYERLVRFNKMRRDKGLLSPDVPLHAMFLGSPGTGKTTVAKLMGQILHEAGVLSSGHVVVRERATLLGMYYSSEGENTLKALEEAQGGILFIDEAYQLYQPSDPKDPGRFVIETLLTALADDSRRDWMLILAGYPDEMRRMFEMNPGFKSRIPESNIYEFDDFSAAELMEIAENYLARYDYNLSREARDVLRDRLNSDWSRRDRSFGNARHVMNMIQTEILPAMAVRVTEGDCVDENQLQEIQASDIRRYAVAKAADSRRRIGYCA